jgi:hypothetical protein
MLNFLKITKRNFSNGLKKGKVSNIQLLQRIRPYYEFPYVEIDRDIPFNKHGLYLLAEEMNTNVKFFSRKLNKINLLFTGFLIVCCPMNLTSNIILAFLFYVINRILRKKNEVRSSVFPTMVSKIYLAENLKDVVVYFPYSDSYKTFDIKYFYLFSEQTFENYINFYAFPVGHTKYNEYSPLFVPHNLKIFDREIFCAIFRGYPLKIKEKKQNCGFIEAKVGTN